MRDSDQVDLAARTAGEESTYGVVGMEDVRGRRVVDDDDLVEVATQSTQVLHVVALVEDTRLPEEAAAEGPLRVQQV